MLNSIEIANKPYLDLYGNCLKDYIQLPANANFSDIKEAVKSNTIIGYKHYIKVGDKCIIAETKYTWTRKVANTHYLHIWVVNNFEDKKVLTYWREQKNGTFKTQ